MKTLTLSAVLAVMSISPLAARELEPLAWFAQTHSYSSFAAWNGYIYAQTVRAGTMEILGVADGRLETLRIFPSTVATYQTIISALDGYLFMSLGDDYTMEIYALAIFDLKDPLAPELISEIPFQTFAADGSDQICYCPPYLYIINGFTLMVYDLSEASQPVVAGQLNLFYASYAQAGIAQSCGNLVAFDGAGLRMIDVSDPTHPRFMGSYHPPSGGWQSRAAGDLVLVQASGGPQLIDVSDPWAPVPIAHLAETEDLKYVGFNGRLAAYRQYETNTYRLFDLSEPSQPRELASWNFDDRFYYCRFVGDMLALLGSAGSILIDVSQPDAPVVLEQRAARPYWSAGGMWDNSLVMATADEYDFYGLANPAHPALIASLPNSPADFHPVMFRRQNGLLLAAGNGLAVFAAGDPSPQQVGFLAADEGIFALTAAASYAYFTFNYDTVDAIHVVDLHDPTQPQELTSVPVAVKVHSLACARDVLYAGCFHQIDSSDAGEILIYDLSDPSAPQLLTTMDTADGPSSILAVDQDRLFAVDGGYRDSGYSALEVYDISDPRTPVLLGAADTPPGGWLSVGYGLLVRADLEIAAYDDAALPEELDRSTYTHNFALLGLDVGPDRLILGWWRGVAGLFRAGESQRSFIGGLRKTGAELTIQAWTPNPGISQVELTYDGLGTGVFLDPTGDGSFEFAAPLSGSEPAGQYLLGLRGEGADCWRPNWPYLEVN